MKFNKKIISEGSNCCRSADLRAFPGHSCKVIAMLLVVFMLLPVSLCPLQTDAAENNLKTVRVAMDDSNLVVKTDSTGKPYGGYGYEYIQTIASYAGWNVEYVNYGGFTDAMNAVIEGEADLYYDISYTEERGAQLLFPDEPMGNETYYIYSLAGNTEVNPEDYTTFNGKTVGVTAGTTMIDLLEQWCEDNDVELNIREFNSTWDEMSSFKSGEIDLDFQINTLAGNQYSALVKIADSDYYLVANRERADLISDINRACQKIQGINPFFINDLEEKYFSSSVVTKTMSQEEEDWLADHNKLKIGYMDDYLPLCDKTDEGKPDGIIKDIVPDILNNLGIKDKLSVEYIGYANSNEMINALKNGEIDAVFPVSDNLEAGADYKLSVTYPVANLSTDLVYFGNFSSSKIESIAVDKDNVAQQYYARSVYPDADLVYYDSMDAALKAVLNGKTGATILNGLRTSQLLSQDAYKNLSTIRLLDSFNLSFAVTADNTELLSILNRSISSMDDNFAAGYIYNYVDTQQMDSFTSFVNSHKKALIVILIAVLVLISISAVNVAAKMNANERRLEKTLSEVESLNVQLSEYARTMARTGYGMWHMFFKEGSPPRAQADDKMKELLGIEGRDLSEEEIYNIWHENVLPEEMPTVKKHFEKQISGQFSEVTYKWRHPEMGVIYVRCGGAAEKLEDGTIVISGYHGDVTEIVLERERKQQEISEYSRIMSDAGFGVWHLYLKDGAAPKMHVNEMMAELLGLKGEKLTDEEFYSKWHENIVPDDVYSVHKTVKKMLSGSFDEITYQWIHPKNGIIYVRGGGVIEKIEDGTSVLSGYHADVTKYIMEEKRRKEEMQSLNRRILTDGLTGANNRNAVDKYLSSCLAENRKNLHVAMIDLDHFKEINDNYGHQAGDDALRLLTKAFFRNLTEHTFFARYGGDEFIMVSTSEDSGEIEYIVENARKSLKEMCLAEKTEFEIGFSCGVVKKTEDMKTISDLLKAADAEMYRVKKEKNALR